MNTNLAAIAADRGINHLVTSGDWLPCIEADDNRVRAAAAYVLARRQGLDRDTARAQAMEAAYLPAEVACQAWEAYNGLRAAETAKNEQRRADEEAERLAKREAAIALNTHDLKTVLKAAMLHTEQGRFHNAGSWSNKRWRLSVTGSDAASNLEILDAESAKVWNSMFPQRVITAANGPAYDALVSILGRRCSNFGGGNRHDVTKDTSTCPKRLSLARSIISRKKVSVKKLMTIADTHARAWAVELTGGWGRMTKLMTVVQKTKDGTLLSGEKVGLTSDMLLVTCPSTGSKYALMVPRGTRATTRTVKAALKHVNGIDHSKIIAAS